MPAAVATGLDALRANPLRTLLSTIGVVMGGAASLAAVLSLGDGAESFARARIAHEGMQRISVEAVTSDRIDGHRVPRARYPMFTPADRVSMRVPVRSPCYPLDDRRRRESARGGTAGGRN